MQPELSEILQLLGAQSHAIDHGDGAGWAATFTADGSFESPSYPEPVRGREALTAFGAAFTRTTPGAQHLLCNTHLVATDQGWQAHSRLLVVRDTGSATELLRLTRLIDSLTHTPDGWRITRRRVLRPDSQEA